jgi:hypothetical protein
MENIQSIELPPIKPVKLPPPCALCGEQEKEVSPGVFRIKHNYELHGFPPSASDKGNSQ